MIQNEDPSYRNVYKKYKKIEWERYIYSILGQKGLGLIQMVLGDLINGLARVFISTAFKNYS